MSDWDRRQLVAARGKLQRASLRADNAIRFLDEGDPVSELRAAWVLLEAESAVTDLRRFINQKQKESASERA